MAYPSVAPSLSGDLGLHLEGLCGGQPSHSSVGQAVARKQSLGGSAAAQETTGSQTVSLTVRTLDKKEHRLSVVHDISVAALKEEVAVITSIDADSQVGHAGPAPRCAIAASLVCALRQTRVGQPRPS
jgi:hypothetical protein